MEKGNSGNGSDHQALDAKNSKKEIVTPKESRNNPSSSGSAVNNTSFSSESIESGNSLGFTPSEDDSVSMVPLSKGREQHNMIKPSTSHRPISPPPPKLASKLNKQKSKPSIKEKPKNSSSEDGKVVSDSDKDMTADSVLPTQIIFNYKVNFEEDDDDDDDDFLMYNPSGSVLKPAPKPYNKQERIRQANIDLFKEDLVENIDRLKIKFDDRVCLLESHTSANKSESLSDKEITVSSATHVVKPTPLLKQHSIEKGDAKNGVPDGLKVKCVNPKVLLVMVPNASHDSINFHSDNSSSSENEDVCVGRSIITGDKIGIKNEEDDVLFQDHTEEGNYDEKEIMNVKNCIDRGGDGIDPEDLDANQNLINSLKSDIFFDSTGGRDICYTPENSTGIQIKITCPNCSDVLNCVEFCSSENEYNSSGLNNDDYLQSPHSCNNEPTDDCILSEQSTNAVLKSKYRSKDKRDSLPQSESILAKSDDSFLKKKPSVIRNTANSISINVQSSNSCTNSLKNKCLVSSESSLEKRKNCYNNKINNKSVDDDNFSPQKFSQKKQNKPVKNKLNINASIIENKENERQSNLNNTIFTKHNTAKSLESLQFNTIKKYSAKRDNISKQKIRPKSCPEHQNKQQYHIKRPATAPVTTRRGCCTWDPSRLPDYNGFRSEYGLSEEQLLERRRIYY